MRSTVRESEAYIVKNFTIKNGKIVDKWGGLPLHFTPRPLDSNGIIILGNDFSEGAVKLIIMEANNGK